MNNYRFWSEKLYRDYRFGYNETEKDKTIKEIRDYYLQSLP